MIPGIMGERRAFRLIVPALGVAIALALLADGLQRHRAPAGALRPPVPARAPESPGRPGGTGGSSEPAAASLSRANAESQPSAGDRAAVRERLRSGAEGTYLAQTVEAADSVVRHWGARRGRAIRIAVRSWTAAGYREEYAGSVEWAVVRWNGVGLPVQLESTRDSVGADVVLTWVDTLGGEAAGQARVTWTGPGEIVRAEVQLVTHMPDGRPPNSHQMATMALHELGHVLGLGHSTDPGDALHPSSTAIELSPRDRRTARLLYELPVGSVKH
jgi:predicted Zn-dependent protease